MKYFCTALATALIGVCCAFETVTLGKTDVFRPADGCQIKAIELIDSNGSATYAAKKETLLFGERQDVTEYTVTNFTYTLVSTNETGLCTTNVTVFDQTDFLPAAEFIRSYVTNSTVSTWSATNLVPVISGAITNDVSTNGWLAPGDVLFFPAADTFTGKVRLYLER